MKMLNLFLFKKMTMTHQISILNFTFASNNFEL
jgi:hypothetical protein